MSWPEFDSVMAEKADAIRRYRNRNFLSCFHRLIAVLALLCSFPYFPIHKEIISFPYLSLFNRQLYVFCLINAMIFIIYRFSNLAARGNNDGTASSAVSHPDLYDEYISLSSSSGKLSKEETKSVVLTATEIQSPEKDKVCDKYIVVCENAQPAPEEEKNPIGELTETKERLPLRRTRSERFTEVMKEKSHVRELRRSETGMGRALAVADSGEKKSMEDMNSDEFRCTIEHFIASKKKVLRDENFAAVMEEKEMAFSTATTA